MEATGIELLFASPLVKFRIASASELNNELVREVETIRATSAGVKRSNRNGWHSEDDLFQRTEPGLARLAQHMITAVSQATLAVSPDFEVTNWSMQLEGWINVNDRGCYNAPHDHPGFAWSGCYYVKVPPNAAGDGGSIEFLDPRTNARVPTVEGAACFLDTRKIKPDAGLMLLFPSYLRHWVYPNDEDEQRISIAFNARFVPRVKS